MGIFSNSEKVAANTAHVEAVTAADKVLADITAKLGAATEQVSSLTIRHGQVAFDTSVGNSTVQEFAAIDEQLAHAKSEVSRLSAARGVAAQKLNEAKLAQRRHVKADMRKMLERKGNQRAKRVDAISTAIVDLNKAWRQLHEDNESIMLAYPEFPAGALLGANEIFKALGVELYRVSGNPFIGSGTDRGIPQLPGAKRPNDHELVGQPEKLPSLTEAMAQANTHLVARLDIEPAPAVSPIAPVADDLLLPAEPIPPVDGAPILTAAQIAATLPNRKIRLER